MHNSIDSDGFEVIAETLQVNSTLEYLNIHGKGLARKPHNSY